MITITTIKNSLTLSILVSAIIYTIPLKSFSFGNRHPLKTGAVTSYTTSFKNIKGGFLFTKAEVNGQEAWFIVDTGMPGLILNTKYYKKSTYAGQVAGASGFANLRKIYLDRFYWNGIKLEQFEAMALELSHLEKALGVSIQGLIGMAQFKRHELLIDYENNTLTISEPGENDNRKYKSPRLVLPFRLQAHLPLLKVKIGGRTFRFGIDTGAASNLISHRKFRKLPIDSYKYLHSKRIHGINKGTKVSQRINIKRTSIASHCFENMPYFVNSLNHLNSQRGIYVDGLLGIPFLSYYKKVSISFPERKIYFW